MTVVNKVSVKVLLSRRCLCDVTSETAPQYVVSGRNFSMNFLLLAIQSSVCVMCVLSVKKLRIISFRNFDAADAKAWFPISFLLVTVIYSGSKSLVR
jgi:GDP-mannose transporter